MNVNGSGVARGLAAEAPARKNLAFVSALLLGVSSSFIHLCVTFPILLSRKEKLPGFVKTRRISQRLLGKR